MPSSRAEIRPARAPGLAENPTVETRRTDRIATPVKTDLAPIGRGKSWPPPEGRGAGSRAACSLIPEAGRGSVAARPDPVRGRLRLRHTVLIARVPLIPSSSAATATTSRSRWAGVAEQSCRRRHRRSWAAGRGMSTDWAASRGIGTELGFEPCHRHSCASSRFIGTERPDHDEERTPHDG